MPAGQRRRASAVAIAERAPNARASYDAVATTPRPPTPPTMTGRPRSEGLSRCSTEAKNASRSRCRTLGVERIRPAPLGSTAVGAPTLALAGAGCTPGRAQRDARRPRPDAVSLAQGAPAVPRLDLDPRADPAAVALGVGAAGVVAREPVDVDAGRGRPRTTTIRPCTLTWVYQSSGSMAVRLTRGSCAQVGQPAPALVHVDQDPAASRRGTRSRRTRAGRRAGWRR